MSDVKIRALRKMSVSKDPISNSHLIQGCASNDRRSQELLYKQYYNPMMALCFRYIRNREDAIEVLHTGFLKVFQHIGSFDETKSALFTWIHTIMVRTSIDFLRKKNPMVQAVEWTEATEPEIQPAVLIDKSGEEIMCFLNQLSHTTATVFNLYVIEGYNHKEIAQLLTISDGTSKWHLSEAKKNLAKLIKNKAIA
jgi:RNA polymerase sigma factor (sigma-70 family)